MKNTHTDYTLTMTDVAQRLGISDKTLTNRIQNWGDYDHIKVGVRKFYPESVLTSHLANKGFQPTNLPENWREQYPLTMLEVAKALNIAKFTLKQRICKRGDHDHIVVGNKRYYPESVLTSHLASPRYTRPAPMSNQHVVSEEPAHDDLVDERPEVQTHVQSTENDATYRYTIKAIAAKIGVPVPTIYARIAAHGDHDHILVGNTKVYPATVFDGPIGRSPDTRPEGFPLKTGEVARRLGISYATFQQRILQRGDYRHIVVGRTKYYPESVLTSHLAPSRQKDVNPFF